MSMTKWKAQELCSYYSASNFDIKMSVFICVRACFTYLFARSFRYVNANVCVYVFVYLCAWQCSFLKCIYTSCMFACFKIFENVVACANVCMYACTCIWMYVCMYVYMTVMVLSSPACLCAWECANRITSTNECIYIYIYKHIYIYTHTCIYRCDNDFFYFSPAGLCAWECAHRIASTNACIYIYIYIHVNIYRYDLTFPFFSCRSVCLRMCALHCSHR
jgi:hypothetical protein